MTPMCAQYQGLFVQIKLVDYHFLNTILVGKLTAVLQGLIPKNMI